MVIKEAMCVVCFWDGKKLVCAKSREPRLDDARLVLTGSFSKRKHYPSAGLLIDVLSQIWSGLGMDPLSRLSHYLEVVRCAAEQHHIVNIRWILDLLHSIHKELRHFIVTVKINQTGLLLWLDHSRRCGNSLDGLLCKWGILRAFTCLALLPFGWPNRRWRGPRGITLGLSWITVDTLHMVSEIPVAWETISGHASFTAFIGTEEGFVAMSMHSVGLTLMA